MRLNRQKRICNKIVHKTHFPFFIQTKNMTSSQRTSIQVALLAFAAVLLTSVASFADTYTLTARTEPQQTGVNGLPEGKSYCDLTSSDTLIVTATGAQLYFNRSANLAVPITVSGFGDGTGAYHATGKFRMQNSGTVVNLNGLVNLAGDTFIGSHDPVGNQGTLNFNNQITGSGGLITCIGTNGYVHLNNTSQTNLNNYQGNTQLGYPEMYNYNTYRPYAGVVYLDANEQIPDALTAGASATGNLILNSYTSNNQISKLYLGNHTETVNGLVSEDTGTALSIITGESGSKLTVGANNATAAYSGLLQGAMQLEKIGTGTQTLSGANTYTGATTISAGTLELTGDGALGTGAVTNSATLKFNFSADKTLTNAISGAGAIVKEGTNTVKLDGAFSSTGNMAINGGKVSVLMDGTNKKFNVKNLSGSGELELRLASGNSDTQMTSLVSDNFTGVISLVQEGAASSNKVYTNTQTFEGFNLKVNNGTSIFIAGSQFKGNVQITGNGNNENRGALRIASSISGNITVASDANIAFDGNNTVSGAIDSGASSGEVTLFINGKTDGTTVTVNRTEGTLSGAISDGTSGSKLGLRIVANAITFSGALSYTGATTVNAGTTMNLSGADANLVNSRAVTVNGKLDFSNYSGSNVMQLNDLSGTTAASEIIGTNKNLILNTNNNTSYAGKVRIGNGTVTTSGTGTLTLTGKDAVLYSGGITVNSTIASTADQTFHNLSGSGDIAFSNNANLTLTSSALSTYSGTISGVNTLTVQQNSAYDLSGTTVSVANFETKDGASVKVSSEKPMTVTNSFRQGNAANYTISGGSASISGDNVAQQATIALNGGTMSINSYNYTAPELPEITSLAVHLDASNASSFDNSSSIGKWNNLANSNNNLTFTGYKGSTSHAYVTEAGLNGLNVMTFPTNGTAYYDMASVVNGVTFFAVMADNGYTASNQYSFLFGNKDVSLSGHNTYCFHRDAGTKLWNSTHLDANIKNGVTSLNGTAVSYSTANIGTGWNVLSIQASGSVPVSGISRERGSLGEARGWRGDIAEVLVYTGTLTEEQYQAVSQYLATKWQVGNDIVTPTVVTTGDFVSTNEIIIVADSTIDVAEFSSVTFGSTTIDEGKTLTVNVAEGQETVWTSPISGEGSFTKSGLGSLTLSEEPAYNGSTTVEAGTLALTEGGTLNNLSGGSLNPNGTIAQSATLDATGKDLTLVNSETTKFIGSIKANNIVANGEGTLQIYTGAEGQVDAQSLTVSSDRVDLKGYMTGSITVNAGSVFSPGNSVGEATLDGSFILNTAAILLMEQDATGMDKLTASSFEIDPNAILELTVGAAIPGATYDIIFQKNGNTAVDFTGDQATDDFWNSLLTEESAYYWNLSVNGNVVSATLDANAVPEPSTWALLILGVVVLFLRKRVRS